MSKTDILTAIIITINLVQFALAETIWTEDFASYSDNSGYIGSGSGAVTTGDYPSSVSKWTLDVSAATLNADTDWFMVNSVSSQNLFETRDSDGECIWTSESITISGYTDVGIQVAVTESGTFESTDYVKLYYKLDSGAETIFETNGNNVDDFTSVTASHSNLSGSTLQIIIKTKNNAGAEYLRFDDVTVTGIPTVNIGNADADAGWRMLSLPITGGTVEDVSDDTPVQGITSGDDASSEANFYINTASDGTGTDGWSEPTNVTTAWGDGLGFILFFFDNTSNGSSVLPVTLDVSGSEPSSNVTVTLSDTYTLVGNPFASNINLDDITGDNSEDGVQNGLKSPISVWTDGAGTDNSGSWTTYNLGGSKIVSTWQGFFLERNSASTTQLTIPTSAKTSSAATISIFSKMMVTNRRTIEFRLDAPNENVDIANKLYFTEISHEGEDGFDGGKLLPLDGSPSLAFIQEFDGEERLLVQDARAYQPEADQTYELAILDAGVGGTYQISWPVMDNIPSGWEINLSDLETGAVVNMQEEEVYTFYVQNPIGQLQTDPLQPVTVDANAVYRNTVPPRFSITISGFALGFDNNSLPNNFALYPAYPNPFNPNTTITIDVPAQTHSNASLRIYDITGRLVATLVDEQLAPGTHTIQWQPQNLSSGLYIVQLKAGQKTFNQKITFIK